MTVKHKSLDDRKKEAPRPQSQDLSARKAIARWEDEGGRLAAAAPDGFDLKASTLANNAGWRADRPTAIGSRDFIGLAAGRRELHRSKIR